MIWNVSIKRQDISALAVKKCGCRCSSQDTDTESHQLQNRRLCAVRFRCMGRICIPKAVRRSIIISFMEEVLRVYWSYTGILSCKTEFSWKFSVTG